MFLGVFCVFVHSTHLLHLHRLQVGIASAITIIVRSRDQKNIFPQHRSQQQHPLFSQVGLSVRPALCAAGIASLEKTRQAGGEWGRWWVKQTTKWWQIPRLPPLGPELQMWINAVLLQLLSSIVKFQFSDNSTVNFEFVHVWTRGRQLTPMRPGSMVRQSERLLGRRLPKDGLQLELMSKQRSCWHWEGVRVRW